MTDAPKRSPFATNIIGLTHPYDGKQPCSRVFAHGHTFRWAKGDRYIAVMLGHCIEQRRHLILKDVVPKPVIEGPQPLLDAIPTNYDDWADTEHFHRLITEWLHKRRRQP